MKFEKTLKLYFDPARKMISLSIRCTDSFVKTFYIELPVFEKILEGQSEKTGVLSRPYYIQRKKGYLRFSFDHAGGLQDNLRVPLEKWDLLVSQYRAKGGAEATSLLTCIVD